MNKIPYILLIYVFLINFSTLNADDSNNNNSITNLIPTYPIYTIGGNSNGAKCYFPFILRNKTYRNCIDMKLIDSHGESHTKICATTANMDIDNRWGFCLDYAQCHFPFKYRGEEYNDCISSTRSSRFCSTTYDYDTDKKWAFCPIVCHGFPVSKGGVNQSNSFNSSAESTCMFNTYYSKISNQPLRVFSSPPCYASFSCKEFYFTHNNNIKCEIDGKFVSQAVCLKKDGNVVNELDQARIHRIHPNAS